MATVIISSLNMALVPLKLLPLYFNVLNLTTNWKRALMSSYFSHFEKAIPVSNESDPADAVVLSVPALTVQQLPVNHPTRRKIACQKKKHCNIWIQKLYNMTMIKTTMSFSRWTLWRSAENKRMWITCILFECGDVYNSIEN